MKQTTRKRSRAYPAVDLPGAIAVIDDLTRELGWEGQNRAAMAEALGFASAKSGAAGRLIAAMYHYGFLSRRSGLYTPTELARQLLESPAEEGLRREAFLHPKLFHDIVERYRDVGAVPRDLGEALAAHCGIRRKVSHDVARIFMESARYAAVLAADGVFLESFQARRKDASGPLVTDAAEIVPADGQSTDAEIGEDVDHGHVAIPIALGRRRFAELKVPVDLEESDLEILKAQLHVLAVQVEVNRPARKLPFDADRSRPRAR
ncbi:MAG: hypothetical protein GY719_37385 [bacterium]|nr:hypothetical protein [bacterium]